MRRAAVPFFLRSLRCKIVEVEAAPDICSVTLLRPDGTAWHVTSPSLRSSLMHALRGERMRNPRPLVPDRSWIEEAQALQRLLQHMETSPATLRRLRIRAREGRLASVRYFEAEKDRVLRPLCHASGPDSLSTLAARLNEALWSSNTRYLTS